MTQRAKELLTLFVEIGVHDDGPLERAQGPAAVDELVRRCIEMGTEDGITQQEMEEEVGDLNAHFRAVIDRKNVAETTRLSDHAMADKEAQD